MTEKEIGLCGVCNPLVDIIVEVTDEDLHQRGFEKGTMRLVESSEQEGLLVSLDGNNPARVDGGSVANSVIAFAQLGGKAAMLASVGADSLGDFYRSQCTKRSIEFPVAPSTQAATGSCVVLVTPDAERTMRTNLGAALLLDRDHLCAATISRSTWVFLEGFLLTNPGKGAEAARRVVQIAKDDNTKIALTLSERWVLDTQREVIDEILPHVDLLFANESEACGLYHTEDFDTVQARIGQDFPLAVVTRSEKGAVIFQGGDSIAVPARQCSPVDVTGAGDMFAGTFLSFLQSGATLEQAGSAACTMSSLVISQRGARLNDADFDVVRPRL